MNMPPKTRIGLFLAVALIAITLLVPGPASAQGSRSAPPDKVAPPPSEPAAPSLPRLRVNGAEQPVRLVSLAIRTNIQSGFAESSLDMVFHNPNKRILEGELEFPISPGQEISGLALDIDGELRRGVPVAKARGQELFDDIARRKVDPALLEATRGNAYRLRVYPLPAGGQRRVALRLMQPLQAQDGQLHYRLPLALTETLDSVSIEAEVVSPGGPVKAEAGNLGLRLEKTGTLYKGRVERTKVSPEGWLDISLPASDSLSGSLAAARWGDKLYFSAAAYVPLPDQARKLPDQVSLLWDASGSGLKRNQAKEFALLDSYFQAFDSGQVRLIVLRNQSEPPREFNIKKGDWAELKEALHGLVYDGATNLTDWRPTADCQEYLLFSDGLDNYRGASGQEAPKLSPEQRLFAINSAATADYAALRALVPGGALIDLAHESPQQAEAKLLRAGARVGILNSALAGAAEAVLGPESAYLSSADGRGGLIRLAGWVKRGGGVKEIPVQIVLPDGTSTKLNIDLPGWEETPEATGEEAPLPARLWGRYLIAGLEGDYKTNKRAIARLGEDLGIVSRETSLIVLETAADYARYGVKPPASLQAQVDALPQNQALAGGQQKLSDERLLSMWTEKVRWWERDFDLKPKTEKPKAKSEDQASSAFNPHPSSQDALDGYGSRGETSASPAEARPYWETEEHPAAPSYWIQDDEPRPAAERPAASQAPDSVTVRPPRTPDQNMTSKFGYMFNGDAYRQLRGNRAPAASEADGESAVWKSEEDSYLWFNALTFGFGDDSPSPNANSVSPVLGGGQSLQTRLDGSEPPVAPTGGSSNKGPSTAGVSLKPWVSDAPYIARMLAAKDEELYAIYLDERPDYLASSAFFIDVADRFFERGLKDLGLRVLSNLAEMQLENRQVLRMLAYRLIQAGEPAAARPVLEQVRELAPYEPQSLRDLALVAAALGQTQEAVDLLYETARRQWSDRFGEINTIALTEMNALIATKGDEVKTEAIDSRLIRNLPSDLRVTLSWDMDNTDMDLWVTAPDGEAAYYKRRLTNTGGRMSQDCTQGYGPEEFILKKALPGLYRVEVNYYGHSRQTIAGEVTMMVTVFSRFGTPQQKEQTSTLRLKNVKKKVLVAEFYVEE